MMKVIIIRKACCEEIVIKINNEKFLVTISTFFFFTSNFSIGQNYREFSIICIKVPNEKTFQL